MSAHPKSCLDCGRWGNRAFRRDDVREGWVCSNDRACARRGDSWMYGFYDSDSGPGEGGSRIYWYVFGFLTHSTAESAEHTGRKSTWGQPVIVRRKRNCKDDWEHAPGHEPVDAGLPE